MGCGLCIQHHYDGVYLRSRAIGSYHKKYQSLGLSTHDIKKLHESFCNILINSNGCIPLSALLLKIEENETPFLRRVFRSYNKRPPIMLEFNEFVLAMWDFCTLTKTTTVDYVFHLYDINDNSRIDIGEVDAIVRDFYGDNWSKNSQALNLHHKLQEDAKHSIDRDTFNNIILTHSAILYPIIVLRAKLREHLCGEMFWQLHDAYRTKMFSKKYFPVDMITNNGGDIVKMERAQAAAKIAQEDVTYRMCNMKVSVVSPKTTSSRKKSIFDVLTASRRHNQLKGGKRMRNESIFGSLRFGNNNGRNAKPALSKPRKKSVFERIIGNGVELVRQGSKDLSKLAVTLNKHVTAKKYNSKATISKRELTKRRVSLFQHFYDGSVRVERTPKGGSGSRDKRLKKVTVKALN